MTGPFRAEAEARQSPQVQAVYEAFDRDPGAGKMAPHNYLMLIRACEAAGVDLGGETSFDRVTLAWLAGFEPAACAVVAGLIARAAAGSKVNLELPGGQPAVDLKTTDRRQADGRQAR